MADHSLTLTLSDGRCYGLYGDVPLDRVCFFDLSVLNRIYNVVRVCQQGIACTNDLIC